MEQIEEKVEKIEEKTEKNNSSKTLDNDNIFYAFAYILFFLPLLAIPGSKQGRFHANQGLSLLIFTVVGYVVLMLLPIFGWLFILVFRLFILILIVIGFLNGWDERERPLPLIGKWFKIIK